MSFLVCWISKLNLNPRLSFVWFFFVTCNLALSYWLWKYEVVKILAIPICCTSSSLVENFRIHQNTCNFKRNKLVYKILLKLYTNRSNVILACHNFLGTNSNTLSSSKFLGRYHFIPMTMPHADGWISMVQKYLVHEFYFPKLWCISHISIANFHKINIKLVLR